MRQWIVFLICGVVSAGAGAANVTARFELPALMQPAVAEEHPGKVIWAELVTSDVARAERFYAALFGWTFEVIHTGDADYSVALLDGAPIAGLVQRAAQPGGHNQPAWLTFLSVRSVRDSARRILAHGGKELTPPRTYQRRGRQAVYADPQGAVFAILHSSSGDPPDVLPAPGEWIWSALLSQDPGTDAAFYQDVFGFEVFELPNEGPAQHLVLSTEQYARASLNALPAASAAGGHPHWIDFVRVSSVANSVATAQALGGRVLIEPHLDRHGGLMAVIADPAGAPIGVLEWNDSGSQGAPK